MDKKKQERKIFSVDEKIKILDITKGKCAHCGKKITIDSMTIEHIYPIDKGGNNSKYNIIGLCNNCNKLKNNFIYDISFYNYIKRDEYYNYYIELCENVYKNSTDSDIFGKCNRTTYAVDAYFKNKANKKSKEYTKMLMVLGKRLEIRPMYEGDIDSEALNIIARNVYYKNDDMKLSERLDSKAINQYMLWDLFKYSTFYGLYKDTKLLSIQVYVNIEDVELSNDKFIENIPDKTGKIYVKFLEAYAESYYEVAKKIMLNMELEYMAVTNNIILYQKYKISEYLKDVMRGFNTTWMYLKGRKSIFYLESLGFTNYKGELNLVTGNKDYETIMKQVKKLREQYINYREIWKQKINKEI